MSGSFTLTWPRPSLCPQIAALRTTSDGTTLKPKKPSFVEVKPYLLAPATVLCCLVSLRRKPDPFSMEFLLRCRGTEFAVPSEVLQALLAKFATSMAKYIKYQADNGAQAVQIFDSWATELSPVDFEEFSLPYLKQIVNSVKLTHPDLPLILYASGSGGLLERLAFTGIDVVSLDWTVDMAESRRRLGTEVAVQGNVDPGVLFGSKEFITNRINDSQKSLRKTSPISSKSHKGFGTMAVVNEANNFVD